MEGTGFEPRQNLCVGSFHIVPMLAWYFSRNSGAVINAGYLTQAILKLSFFSPAKIKVNKNALLSAVNQMLMRVQVLTCLSY